MSHWYDSTPKKSRRKRDSNPGSSALEADVLLLGQRGGFYERHATEDEEKNQYLIAVSLSAEMACFGKGTVGGGRLCCR